MASFRSNRALGAGDAGVDGVGAGKLVVVALHAVCAGPKVAGGAAPFPRLAVVAVNQSGDSRFRTISVRMMRIVSEIYFIARSQ